MILQGFTIAYGGTTIRIKADLEGYKKLSKKKEIPEHKAVDGSILTQKIGFTPTTGELEGIVKLTEVDTLEGWYLNDNTCVFKDCFNKTFNVWIKAFNTTNETATDIKVFLEMVVV